MLLRTKKDRRILELSLIVVCLGLLSLLYQIQGYKMVVLNLFFLPVVLTAFYLGRYRAGLLALFSVVGASVVVTLQLDALSVANSPMVMALSVVVWGAVLGMTALLVGTLSDERQLKSRELHEAYIGVVEVLAQYLQSAQPELQNRSTRAAELGQQVAERLNLSPQQVDDVRIAALLYDLDDVEITSRVIRRAMGRIEAGDGSTQHTFQGKDLVFSLGTVLSGALPLLRDEGYVDDAGRQPAPLGAHVIRATRAVVEIQERDDVDLLAAVEQLRADDLEDFSPEVLDVLAACGEAGMTGRPPALVPA